MIPYMPDARSQILNATHIFRIHVSASQAGGWSPRTGFGIERRVELTLQIDEILKGQVNESAGTKVLVEVKQADTGASRDAQMPGLWSGVSTEPGEGYVAFSRAPEERSSEALLREPACRSLIPVAAALFDVRLARETTAEDGIESILRHFRTSASHVGVLYPDYLMELRGRKIIFDASAFDLLAGTLETPELGAPARVTLLQDVYDAMNLQVRAPQGTIDRFVLALFRILKLSQASSLHENIIDSYLPTFVAKSSADQVFGRYPEERKQVRQILSGRPHADGLLQWLDGK